MVVLGGGVRFLTHEVTLVFVWTTAVVNGWVGGCGGGCSRHEVTIPHKLRWGVEEVGERARE